ncbi:hypothetical protein F4553_005249 [Allocatelliglobosispora scoriae]|uniref:Uncharacterized protein n=1 Tax=Allocatelliglobosispora scoriae TaxID=643052 RepID=A0A841BYS4_9ACTN|nr:hypothetical protein [Allocatelliglobosispora scoriae]MBB5871870.1 hypothetical protein [Allocatelliglobosispora scoriae]
MPEAGRQQRAELLARTVERGLESGHRLAAEGQRVLADRLIALLEGLA